MMNKSITGGYYKSVNNSTGKEKSLQTNRHVVAHGQNIFLSIL